MEATSFPQSIAMGSTWNPELMLEVATAISDEARAYYNQGVAFNNLGQNTEAIKERQLAIDELFMGA